MKRLYDDKNSGSDGTLRAQDMIPNKKLEKKINSSKINYLEYAFSSFATNMHDC